MSLKKYLLLGTILAFILVLNLFNSDTASIDTSNSLFQVSTLNSLSAGNFDGNFSAGELKKYGNTGIGTFNGLDGEMVGFWCPASASSLNLNDYHFHFVDEKRNSGGHVLDLRLKNVILEIDYIPDIYLFSPEKDDFIKFNLTNN